MSLHRDLLAFPPFIHPFIPLLYHPSFQPFIRSSISNGSVVLLRVRHSSSSTVAVRRILIGDAVADTIERVMIRFNGFLDTGVIIIIIMFTIYITIHISFVLFISISPSILFIYPLYPLQPYIVYITAVSVISFISCVSFIFSMFFLSFMSFMPFISFISFIFYMSFIWIVNPLCILSIDVYVYINFCVCVCVCSNCILTAKYPA